MKLRIIRQNLHGMDIDPVRHEHRQAASVALVGGRGRNAPAAAEPGNQDRDGRCPSVRDVGKQGRFDIVLANPPYVDSHTMVKNQPDYREAVAARYGTAKGAWDLYVPFWQRALELLAPHGIATLITPNKWLSVGYGKALRRLAQGRVVQICDYSSFRAFENLGVASIVVSMKKEGSEQIEILHFTDGPVLRHCATVPAAFTARFDKWGLLLSKHLDLLVRLIDSQRKLADVCDVEEAFAVDEAYRLAPHIEEHAEVRRSSFKFINTGTIDPYVALWGIRRTTYLKAKYDEPAIEKARFQALFPRRFEQMSSAKIILSGMRHFEAFFDATGDWVAGISTVILRNFRRPYSPLAVLGIMNSRLVRFFLKECFGSLGIDQGINFSRPNVSEIPVPRLSKRNRPILSQPSKRSLLASGPILRPLSTKKSGRLTRSSMNCTGLPRRRSRPSRRTVLDRKGRVS